MVTPALTASMKAARALERVGRLLRERENETQLNPAQWDALRFLASANRFSRAPAAVAAWLATTRGTASQTLLALERKGLVTRSAEDRDRRSVRLDLTEAGRRALERDPVADLAAAIARLPPLHAAALGQALARILDDLLAGSRRPAFGSCDGCDHARDAGGVGPTSLCARFGAPIPPEERQSLCVGRVAAAA